MEKSLLPKALNVQTLKRQRQRSGMSETVLPGSSQRIDGSYQRATLGIRRIHQKS